jgi:cytochrome c-type biogenesis protein CcmH/NrfF
MRGRRWSESPNNMWTCRQNRKGISQRGWQAEASAPLARGLRASKVGQTLSSVNFSLRRFRFTLAALLLAFGCLALAQTVSEKPSPDVRRVGMRLACKCGCKDSVATCAMLECGFSKPAKERIARMQAAGFSDRQIVDAFIRDYGPGIYLAPPSAVGWAVPYAAGCLGLLVIWIFIKKYGKPKPLVEVGPVAIDDPALAKYKDQIEKDLASLE